MSMQNKLILIIIALIISPMYVLGENKYSRFEVYSSDEDNQYRDRRYYIPDETSAITDEEGTDFIVTNRNPLREVFTNKMDKDAIIYKDGSTLLMKATSLNDITIVEKLLNIGANPNVANFQQGNMTALMIAAYNGNAAIITLLTNHKANLNQVTVGGMTALLIACQEKQFATTKLLINLGANVNQANNKGVTSLMSAARRGNDDMVTFLLKKHADLDLTTEKLGETALMAAAANTHCSTIKILLEAGANRNIKTKQGLTAEDYYARREGTKPQNCIALFTTITGNHEL